VEHKVEARFRSSFHIPRTTFTCIVSLLVVLLFGVSPVRAQDASSQISVYLEKTNIPSDSILHFNRLTLQGDYTSFNLTLQNPAVRLQDLARQQILLTESQIDPGRYHTLLIWLDNHVAAVKSDSADSLVGTISLPLTLDLRPGQAQCLFLQWTPAPAGDSANAGSFRQKRKSLPPITALAFVSNEQSSNVSLIDRTVGEVVGAMQVGQDPQGMAYSSRRNLLFVANAGSNSVTVIDILGQGRRAVIELDFGDEPVALCLSPDDRKLFSANRGSNSVTIMDAVAFSRWDKVSVGSSPRDIIVDPASGWVYTANSLSDDVTAFNPSDLTTIRRISVGSFPQKLEINQKDHILYAANYNSGSITQIQTKTFTVTGTLTTSHSVSDLAYDSRAGVLYCALEDFNLVAVLKPYLNLDLNRISVGAAPARLSLDPEGLLLYVSCANSNNINLINCNSGQVKSTIATGLKPCAIVFP
jgi:YVTN family beta-propeller protein